MSWYGGGVIQYPSPNNGTKGWFSAKPAATVLHETYGAEGGDMQVGLYGVGFHFYVTKDGRCYQFYDTAAICWHCNGANWRAIGIEFEGSGEPLTAEQVASGGVLIGLIVANEPTPETYVDPAVTAPASIWVNGGGFAGFISHFNVKTDDGSSQHTDQISLADWQAMTGADMSFTDADRAALVAVQSQVGTIINELNDPSSGVWAAQLPAIRKEVEQVLAKITGGSTAPDGTVNGVPLVDYAKLAKAVADELARRIAA